MRKLLLCVLTSSIFFNSCFKKDSGCSYGTDNATASASDQQQLKSYLDSAHITATLDASGFYYSISDPGSDLIAKPCSQITVSYKGWVTNGKIFDQQNNAVFASLGSLIDGWRQGIPLIGKGGAIRLYIPPTLGYGSKGVTDNTGNPVVPPNSIIIFDISLINVQ